VISKFPSDKKTSIIPGSMLDPSATLQTLLANAGVSDWALDPEARLKAQVNAAKPHRKIYKTVRRRGGRDGSITC
jgi:hypothetical protein